MAFSELIKDFERIREYMRQFYVYGFKSRSEYDLKSARSYDNERRRMDSWLSGYMSFRQDAAGKNVYLSVDSRNVTANPLYHAFKAKSFTSGDVTFHFCVLDLLGDGEARTIRAIADELACRYAAPFENAVMPDESTLRKRLKEYVDMGILCSEKRGRELVFRLAEDRVALAGWRDALDFFSEAAPLGVIGSTLMDKLPEKPRQFRFKHHYLLNALDSEVLCGLLEARGARRLAEITVIGRRKGQEERRHTVYPWKIYVSTQTGREYVLCYHLELKRPIMFRLDGVHEVCAGDAAEDAARWDALCEAFSRRLWGVSSGLGDTMEHVEMTLRVGPDEPFIVERLMREKRCGTVKQVGPESWRFTADVADAAEMLPWIRTFIGRIERLECTNPCLTERFRGDVEAMREMYGGESDAVS